MGIRIKYAAFLDGAGEMDRLPAVRLPEAAVIGRSNSGKSSLINRLSGRKKLAIMSSTPGRTQQINLFEVGLVDSGVERRLCLADLPGFGYARVSKGRRDHLEKMTAEYLARRGNLKAVCLLNDCRRMPEEEELAARDLAFDAGRAVTVALTKCDRLKRNELTAQRRTIAAAYGLESGDVEICGDGIPAEDLWRRLLDLLFV